MYGLEIDTFDCFLRLSVCRLVLCISIKAPQPQCSVLRPATRRHMPRPASTLLRSGISLANRLVAVGTYQNITSILALTVFITIDKTNAVLKKNYLPTSKGKGVSNE
jgi:hypothetical protein